MNGDRPEVLARLLDKEEIRDAVARYARAVDRGDWDGIRAAYHPDGHDDHGGYSGGVDGLLAYLRQLLAGAEGGMHFLGNFLVEFAGPDLALAETHFVSERVLPPSEGAGDDRRVRLGWGRYVDRFERRDGVWRVAHRVVVMDAVFQLDAVGGARVGASNWGARDGTDPLATMRARVFGETE